VYKHKARAFRTVHDDLFHEDLLGQVLDGLDHGEVGVHDALVLEGKKVVHVVLVHVQEVEDRMGAEVHTHDHIQVEVEVGNDHIQVVGEEANDVQVQVGVVHDPDDVHRVHEVLEVVVVEGHDVQVVLEVEEDNDAHRVVLEVKDSDVQVAREVEVEDLDALVVQEGMEGDHDDDDDGVVLFHDDLLYPHHDRDRGGKEGTYVPRNLDLDNTHGQDHSHGGGRGHGGIPFPFLNDILGP